MSSEPDNNPHVLFVEDDASIAGVMTRYLGAAGYATEAVTSVDAALRAFETRKPDIIVTDIFIGEDDSFGLIEAIRAQDPELPIIAISGGRAGFAAESASPGPTPLVYISRRSEGIPGY